MITPATTRTNVNAPARVANPRYDKVTYQDTLAASEAAGFRERAMNARSQMITLGAIGIDRNGPVWLTGDETE